jgi:hypothetical protein
MSMTFTVWRLQDGHQQPAHCTVGERGGEWELIVRRGHNIFLCERCNNEDLALERSNELWDLLLEQGWTERRPPIANS